MSQSEQPVADSKWVKGLSVEQSLPDAAHRIVQSRLAAVLYWLPLAAEKSDEDVEYVHQLRVSTRRAVEALRVFAGLIPQESGKDLRGKLSQVRQAAGEARNLDVLRGELVRCTEAACQTTLTRIAQAITRQRQDAQQPIVNIYRELVAGKIPEQINGLLQQITSRGEGRSQPTFGQHASAYLRPLVKKFFKASEADLSDEEALHRLRIRTKKLRYTMEIVEVAFEPCFRKKLYRRVVALQDLMGMVNDRAEAKTLLSQWVAQSDDGEAIAFFQGLLVAETRAHEDLRQVFRAVWTPQAANELQQEFRACCGFA